MSFSPTAEMYGKGYGMPSSHAQFVAYFAVYLCLWLFYRRAHFDQDSWVKFRFLERLATTFAVCFGSSLVAVSRIYLNYHTPKQVLAGYITGSICAFGWFYTTHFLRKAGWIDQALDLAIVRFVRIRDLAASEDLSDAAWQRWEATRKLRRHANNDPPSHKSD